MQKILTVRVCAKMVYFFYMLLYIYLIFIIINFVFIWQKLLLMIFMNNFKVIKEGI